MKKKLKALFMSLLLVMVMPAVLILSGCGATPANEILGVTFVSPNYDEETGLAVFEVDINVATPLTYKFNPSSGSGYAVTYAIKECPAQNLSRFTLKDGVINVVSSAFEDIKVDIYVNGQVDTCIVKLKKYPTSMFLYDVDGVSETKDLEISINALSTYTINPVGRFLDASGRSYVKPLLEYDYSFEVTTSDPTIIDVPLQNRLKINAVTAKPSTADITVKLLNTAGQVLQTVNIKVNVVLNATNASVILDGYGEFVSNGDEIEIDANALEVDGDGNYVIGYQVFAFSSDGRFVEQANIQTICRVSETRYIEYSKTEDAILVDMVSSSLTFKMSLWTNLIDDEGLPFMISFNVTITE